MSNQKIPVFAVTLLLAAAFVGARFPKDPKPCRYEDSECIKNIINFLMREKVDGYSPLNLVSLNPLKIAKISIKQGEESPVNIDLQLRNSELLGLKDSKAFNVKGFGKDLSQIHEIFMETDSVTLLGDYTISGRVLILPVSGTGKSNITIADLRTKMTITGEPLDKDGEKYMHIKNFKMAMEIGRMYFNFENLFNGNKALGDNMNKFLNDNWESIYAEVRQSINSAFASIFHIVIDNVFQKYPYNKLLTE